MIDSFRVVDDFCPEIDRVRHSALASGFGTWSPSAGEIGSSVYEGMNFIGEHSPLIAALSIVEGQSILPNTTFFRVTTPGMEPAYIHSDREMGARTCVVYLSDHDEDFGTAFYRHKATGYNFMPPMAEMRDNPEFGQFKKDMVDPTDEAWHQLAYVAGQYNRALIFHAPLLHSRHPRGGIGTDPTNGRMVWVCHYHTPFTLPRS